MTRWGVASTLGIVGAACGCSATVEVAPSCGAAPSELEAIARATGHAKAFRGRQRLAVARACADIVSDLTGEPRSVQRPLSQEAGAQLCAEAKAAIEARLDAGADLAAGVLDYGACQPFVAAVDACRFVCGTGEICEGACRASGTFQAGCRLPRIEVESTDPELRVSVASHFAPILALDLFVSSHAGDGRDELDAAIASLRARLNATEGCEGELRELDALSHEASVAIDETLELSTWVRISRLTMLD